MGVKQTFDEVDGCKFFTALVSSQEQSELPSFSWEGDASPFGVPFLKLSFPDQGNDDFAVMRPYNPIPLGPTERAEEMDSCIYQGFLLNEKDVHVTMTGCAYSDDFKV